MTVHFYKKNDGKTKNGELNEKQTKKNNNHGHLKAENM